MKMYLIRYNNKIVAALDSPDKVVEFVREAENIEVEEVELNPNFRMRKCYVVILKNEKMYSSEYYTHTFEPVEEDYIRLEHHGVYSENDSMGISLYFEVAARSEYYAKTKLEKHLETNFYYYSLSNYGHLVYSGNKLPTKEDFSSYLKEHPMTVAIATYKNGKGEDIWDRRKEK